MDASGSPLIEKLRREMASTGSDVVPDSVYESHHVTNGFHGSWIAEDQLQAGRPRGAAR
jgi:hypothetical protein